MDWLNSWLHSTEWYGKLTFAFAIVAAFLAIIGLLLFLIDKAPKTGREKWQAFLFLLPALILVLVGLVVPIVSTLWSSLTNENGDFIWFKNFQWAWDNQDVHTAFWNTIKWVLIAPIASTLVGLAYAMVIDGVRGEGLAKALVFLPTAISFVGAAVIWSLMYQQPSLSTPPGLVNEVLSWVGLGPLGFPTNSTSITYLLIVIMVWIQAGFATVVLSAAIKAVPVELVEASKLDGASGWQTFRRIIVPSIRSSIIVVLVTISIATLKVFDLVQTFGANQYGGDTLANQMFTLYQQAGIGSIGEHYSSTIAMIIFLLVIPFVAFQVREMRKNRAVR
jgi:alpha-glucoside transport system permease protein